MSIVKKRGVDATAERQLVTGLIVSEDFTKQLLPIFNIELLDSRLTKLVASWCIDYYKEFKSTPNRTIQDIFEVKEQDLDQDTSTAVASFLEDISNEYDREKFNYKYYFEKSKNYLRHQNLKRLYNRGRSYLMQGDLAAAELELNGFNQIQTVQIDALDIFNDHEGFAKALERDERDVVFKFRGELGRIISESSRGELLSFTAPEKRGKSWWLQEVGLISVLDGYNVAFFSLEMTQKQMATRLAMNLTGSPSKEKHKGCEVPYLGPGNEIKYKRSSKAVLSPEQALKKIKSLKPMTRGGTFKLVCWPPRTRSMIDVKAQLVSWEEYENFVPDLIVVDHFDRLKPAKYENEFRHGIDSIWEDGKSLAMDQWALVATATHAKIEAATKRITEKSANAEDKRKAGHVDRQIALNQTKDEKKKGLMRLNVIYERNDDALSHLDVVVLSCLKIGKPYLDSYVEEIETEEDDGNRKNKNSRRRTRDDSNNRSSRTRKETSSLYTRRTRQNYR